MRSIPFLAAALVATAALAQTTGDAPVSGNPAAIVNLRTSEGAALAKATWRFAEAKVVDRDHRAPGDDLKASGAPIRTHDLDVRGAAGIEEAKWETIDPASLETRRGTGRLSFVWYRIDFTVPERLGGFDPTGSTVVFEIVVDDYAEIWVDGKLPVVAGQAGGPLVKGWNAPNRVVVTDDARPGRKHTIAVFAANGPMSDPPANFIWVRSATLDFYPKGRLGGFTEVKGEVVRLDPAIDAVVPRGVKFEKVAGGFQFVEGPVWVKDGGYLLFSDPNANRIYRWTKDGEVSVFRTKSGYAGIDIGEYGQPGSNGLALDPQGRLTIDEHGNRRVTRLEPNGVLTVLADRYEGKRLNSPNDLVYRSDGTLYFTDPPFGLPKFYDDPRKELPYSGVFRLRNGELKLVSTDLLGPNGLAFSPDEKYLYVDNWDEKKKVVMRYEVREDGTLENGRVFFDMKEAPEPEALDGLKVDPKGNLFVSGPGGVWVISPEGKHLGTIRLPEPPANFAWGDDDGRTLYMTARTSLYRARL